jgi:exonuclease SbcC
LTQKTTASEALEQLEDVEIHLSACEQEAERLGKTESGMLRLHAAIRQILVMQDEYHRLQEQFLNEENVFNKVNAGYIQKESAFFREQAGILAVTLQDGAPCPVCGSNVHPHKAVPSLDAPSEAELQKAKQECERFRQNMLNSSKKAAAKETEIKSSKEYLMQSSIEYFPYIDEECTQEQILELINNALKECKHKKQENADKSQRLQEQAARKKQYKEQLALFEQSLKDNEEITGQKERRKNEITAELASKTGEITTLQSSLEYPTRGQALENMGIWSENLKLLKESLQKADEAYHALQNKLEGNRTLHNDHKERLSNTLQMKVQAFAAYTEKLVVCDFSDEETYHYALKTEQEMKDSKLVIEQYEDAVKTAEQDLLRLSKETENQQPQDLEQLESVKQKLEAEKHQIDESTQNVIARLGNNEPIVAALHKTITYAQTSQSEYLLVSNLSRTANGELSGKQKLAFEQYVQASYFNQILMEANKRLKLMTSNRFELFRREEAIDYRSQTGLEIDVLDHYTGRLRSVKSLSGGESFKASLALALGLSDVIQGHAGGVEIDTLFIDEGFGALDAESLEQAIQTLSGLASGNRLVGIISHVSELKERIDKQIIIEKSHSGSVIRLIS